MLRSLPELLVENSDQEMSLRAELRKIAQELRDKSHASESSLVRHGWLPRPDPDAAMTGRRYAHHSRAVLRFLDPSIEYGWA